MGLHLRPAQADSYGSERPGSAVKSLLERVFGGHVCPCPRAVDRGGWVNYDVFRDNLMRFGLLALLALVPGPVQGSVPVAWPGHSLSEVGTAPEEPEPTQVVVDPGWERLKAGFVGGFVGGGLGLVVGAAVSAFSARGASDVDAGSDSPRTSPVVAGVAIGAVVGGFGAFLFPGTGTPSIALRSALGRDGNQALVFDLCLVSKGF